MKEVLLGNSKECQAMCKERQVKVGVDHWYWGQGCWMGMPWEVWEPVPHLLWAADAHGARASDEVRGFSLYFNEEMIKNHRKNPSPSIFRQASKSEYFIILEMDLVHTRVRWVPPLWATLHRANSWGGGCNQVKSLARSSDGSYPSVVSLGLHS